MPMRFAKGINTPSVKRQRQRRSPIGIHCDGPTQASKLQSSAADARCGHPLNQIELLNVSNYIRPIHTKQNRKRTRKCKKKRQTFKKSFSLPILLSMNGSFHYREILNVIGDLRYNPRKASPLRMRGR